MKIAIIGGTGLLGSSLLKLYNQKGYEVKAFSRSHKNNIPKEQNTLVNFNHIQDSLAPLLIHYNPDIIINAIGLVNLNLCEQDYTLANRVNTDIPVELSKIAKRLEAYYIHISTDHFFNDNRALHAETDTVNLLNNYAKTKYIAEEKILDAYPLALIVRTNILGYRKSETPSFFEWLLHSLEREKNIYLYDNYFTSPISTCLLGDLLLKCYEKKITGIYNIASSKAISKYDFGIQTAKIFNLSTEHITKTSYQNDDIKRALTLGLDISKIEKALGIKMPTIEGTLLNLKNIRTHYE